MGPAADGHACQNTAEKRYLQSEVREQEVPGGRRVRAEHIDLQHLRLQLRAADRPQNRAILVDLPVRRLHGHFLQRPGEDLGLAKSLIKNYFTTINRGLHEFGRVFP